MEKCLSWSMDGAMPRAARRNPGSAASADEGNPVWVFFGEGLSPERQQQFLSKENGRKCSESLRSR